MKYIKLLKDSIRRHQYLTQIKEPRKVLLNEILQKKVLKKIKTKKKKIIKTKTQNFLPINEKLGSSNLFQNRIKNLC
jgi:hypothetical protein